MIDKILDAIIDTAKLLPFLLVSFILMEWIEHKMSNKQKLIKANKYGPLAGATLGIVPQCGFSVIAANLYAARVITLGTIFAIFLTTSDEMIPIMIAHKIEASIIIKILFTKFMIGLGFGVLVDLFYKNKKKNEITHICKEDNCHCEKDGIIKSSIIHTLKIAAFILTINVLLNFIVDEKTITNFISSSKILTPIITSIIGLIPNCVASVIITELYLGKIISFGSCISGLLSGSGLGLLVLFKQNKNLKQNVIILISLILISSICGIIFNII